MTPPVPARITIEIHPADGQAAWAASARVDDEPGRGSAPVFAATASEPRLEERTPPEYDAGDCTCHGDWCGRDHDND
jgi:hypothetical protein